MTGKLFVLVIFVLMVWHVPVSASSLQASPDSEKTATNSKTPDPPCLNAHYEYKKIRPESAKNLPFPPEAIIVVNKCLDGSVKGKISSEEELKQAQIDKEKAVKKLSFLLSFIYHQQNNLAGSYKETDQAYQDLTEKNVPVPKVYNHAVSNYENALKNYGEYQAYLSAVPRAVSDYEKKTGSSFKEFALEKEDGLITMMKTSSIAELSNSLDTLELEGEKSISGEIPDEKTPENKGDTKDKNEARQNLCMLAGALGGATLTENIILATLSNPLSTALGVSLGATLCTENFYEKMTLWPRNFKAKVVDMGAYIKDGLEGIGNGLYDIGKKYLYVSPSKTGEKITEHYENAKSWLNRKLGWE